MKGQRNINMEKLILKEKMWVLLFVVNTQSRPRRRLQMGQTARSPTFHKLREKTSYRFLIIFFLHRQT